MDNLFQKWSLDKTWRKEGAISTLTELVSMFVLRGVSELFSEYRTYWRKSQIEKVSPKNAPKWKTIGHL